ncbi:MAG: TonB-dependent receptor plug domain-containing protein, partial [Chitinophagales bacterium]|nr:TonB-dependent receptor plug domain-containing protein [Chitinophagales bacterium]
MKVKIIIASIFIASGFAGVHAMNYQQPDSGKVLNEVVVSGTMRETSRMASSIAVEIYTPNFFQKNNSPVLFESLNMINGIQPQLNCNVCGSGDIHINGMEGPYTMVLIDGMPIVSALSTVYGLQGIPNSLINRVEVVKGPASTLYGSEAVAGIINVITKDPQVASKVSADVSASTYGEINFDAAAVIRAKKAASLTGVNYFDFSNKVDINKDNFTDIALQRRFSLFHKWSIPLDGYNNIQFASRYLFENRWGGQMEWNNKLRGSDSIYGESILTHRTEIFGTAAFKLGNEFFKADFSHNYHRQDSWYGVMKYLGTQHTAFAQLRWMKTIGNHYLLAGLPFRFTYYDDNTVATERKKNNLLYNIPVTTILSGVFLQYEGNLLKHLTILAGLRYDYNLQHGSIFSPRLSFKIPLNNSHTFRLSGGNGYRVVNLFAEEHAALTGARQVVLKEQLQPERSWNGNINYSGFINHRMGYINLDINGFYTYFTNKIFSDYLSDPDKIIFSNINGYAISRGASLNADFSFSNSLSFSLGCTAMDVFQVHRDSLKRAVYIPQMFAPFFSGTFTVSYTIPKIQLNVDL